MKIPIILAQSEPGVAPAPRAEGGALAAPYVALYRGAQTAQAAAENAALQLAATNAKIQKQSIDVETQSLAAQMEYNAKIGVNAAKEADVDPDGYYQKAMDSMKGAYQATVDIAKYPETKANLAQKYQVMLKTLGVDVDAHARNLRIDRNKGLLNEGLNSLRILGSQAPDQPAVTEDIETMPGEPSIIVRTKGATDYFNEGDRLIEQARPSLGNKDTADLKIKWREDFITARANEKIRRDPFADISNYARVLSPDKMERLASHQDAMRRSALAAQQHEDAAAQKAVNDLHDANNLAIQQLITDGRFEEASRRLAVFADSRAIRASDYRQLRDDIAKGPSKRPSDEPTYERYRLDIHGSNPQTSEATLKADPRINPEDKTKLLDVLHSRREQQRSQTESDLQKRHNQAEQQLRAYLGINPSLIVSVMKDDPASILYAQGLDILTKRSANFEKTYGGKEDPLLVINEIGPNLQQALIRANKAKDTDISASLLKPTREALEQARRAGLSDAIYFSELKKFDRLDALRKPVENPTPAKPNQRKDYGGRQ